MAALLACGPEAAVSHESAAGLRELAGARPSSRAVDVALRRGHRRPRTGIRLHRLRTLAERDVSTVDGVAVTTAARTLLDLALRWRPRALERTLADALERGLTTTRAMRALLERHSGYPGTRRLRRLLEGDGPALTRSVLEADFLALDSSRAAFERDRRRDAELATRGIRVVRITLRQLTQEHEAVLVRLGGALMAGR